MPTMLELRPTPAPVAPRVLQPPARSLLVVVLGPEDVDIPLSAALAISAEERRKLFVGILRPRPAWTADPQARALLAERSDHEIAEMVAVIAEAAADAGVRPTVSVHVLPGLGGPDRARLLERAVARLARRHDAQPLGGWAA